MSAADSGSPDLGRRQQEPPLADVNGTSVSIKKEPEEDIKDFAETTMNELLGWYGYDKVNTGETKSINLSLSRFSSSSSPPHEGSESEDGSRDTTESQVLVADTDSTSAQQNSGGSAGVLIECSWCSKSGLKLFTLKTCGKEPKAFCSELCFSQCRRATFKKSRICDWCKHVRHTVNYVDFQDGAHQLQFCGDKCLNQYKMHIFCKETQAYLQMHPHLQEIAMPGSDAASGASKLITPDLWLRDCKDGMNGSGHSVHSDDDTTEPAVGVGSRSSTVEQDEAFAARRQPNITESSSKPCDTNSTAFNIWEKIESHRKEFNKTLKGKDSSRRSSKQSSRSNESLLSRRLVTSSVSPKPSLLPPTKTQSPLSPVPVNHDLQINGSSHHTLSTRTSPNHLQPPRIVPSSSPSLTSQPHSHTSSTSSGSSIPPGIPPPPPLINSELFRPPFPSHFYHPSFNYLSQQQQLEYFLRAQAGGAGMRLGMTPPPPPPAHFPHPTFSSPFLQPSNPISMASHSFGSNSLVPPPTIMIPYPVIIPLPLPIPIPIPIPLAVVKKSTTANTVDHPETNPAEHSDNTDTGNQNTVLSEDSNNPTDRSISTHNKTEENVLVDVEEVKNSQVMGSEVHNPLVHAQGHNDAQPSGGIVEDRRIVQPMTLTRSKSKNVRGFASSRETKRPRLMDRHGS